MAQSLFASTMGEFQIFGKMVEYRIVVEYSLHPSLLELCEIVCYLRKVMTLLSHHELLQFVNKKGLRNLDLLLTSSIE
ncbi:unnamed protein product [Larinioides sclopetarius]|uniref:Uncharacterized protein n=1 Tax=Larinioides sclopetarius TaxID=280406 RepID=A0AAV1ZTM2_9ARAC